MGLHCHESDVICMLLPREVLRKSQGKLKSEHWIKLMFPSTGIWRKQSFLDMAYQESRMEIFQESDFLMRFPYFPREVNTLNFVAWEDFTSVLTRKQNQRSRGFDQSQRAKGSGCSWVQDWCLLTSKPWIFHQVRWRRECGVYSQAETQWQEDWVKSNIFTSTVFKLRVSCL